MDSTNEPEDPKIEIEITVIDTGYDYDIYNPNKGEESYYHLYINDSEDEKKGILYFVIKSQVKLGY